MHTRSVRQYTCSREGGGGILSQFKIQINKKYEFVRAVSEGTTQSYHDAPAVDPTDVSAALSARRPAHGEASAAAGGAELRGGRRRRGQ